MAILWLGIVVCNVQVVSSAQQHSSNCLVCMYILLLQITDNGLVQHYRQAGFFCAGFEGGHCQGACPQ